MHEAVTNGAYDVSRIREDFPILAMQVYGKPLVYLDNAASAQKPKAVLDRLQHAYTAEYANVHRGLHYLANAATEAYEGAREKVRAFLNAARTEEIIFTRNATEAINLVAYTFGRERIKAGDEIVLSIMEHHSNIVPWHFLRERQGAVHQMGAGRRRRQFPDRRIREAALAAHQDGRDHPYVEHARHPGAGERGGAPRACPRHSGAARRRPGRRPSRRRRAGHRLRFLRRHRPQALRADRHRRALRQARASRGHAAVQRRRRDDPRSVRGPHHLRRAAAQIRGRHAADRAGDRARRRHRLCQFDRQGADQERTRPGSWHYAQERLREINSLRIFGTAKDKGPIVSFEIKGAHPHDVATIIDRSGIAVRAGTHCVMPLLARFGVSATCRASFGLYNTRDGGGRPCAGLDQGAGFLRMTDDQTASSLQRPRPRRPRLARAQRRRRHPRCRKTSWRG